MDNKVRNPLFISSILISTFLSFHDARKSQLSGSLPKKAICELIRNIGYITMEDFFCNLLYHRFTLKQKNRHQIRLRVFLSRLERIHLLSLMKANQLTRTNTKNRHRISRYE